jgi:hypothetical protein
VPGVDLQNQMRRSAAPVGQAESRHQRARFDVAASTCRAGSDEIRRVDGWAVQHRVGSHQDALNSNSAAQLVRNAALRFTAPGGHRPTSTLLEQCFGPRRHLT